MPELPDVTVYVECLAERVVDQPIAAVRLASPFVLRTAVPPVSEVVGKVVCQVRRMGKRIVVNPAHVVYAEEWDRPQPPSA